MSFQANAFQVDAFQVQGATYLLLAPHVIGSRYFDIGTVIQEGYDVPANWPPSLSVDPLDAYAVQFFYNAGPRGLGWESLMRASGQGTVPPNQLATPQPITYWTQQSPGVYVLTGLGAGLTPVRM